MPKTTHQLVANAAAAPEHKGRELSFTQSLRRACQTVADKVAVVDGERSFSWRELGDRSARLAGAMQVLGMAPGGRVAILANNCHQYAEYYYGVPWGGGVFVPLNYRLAAAELTAILVDADVKILLVDDANLALSQDILAASPVQHVVHIGQRETPAGAQRYEDLLARATAVEDFGGSGDDVVCLFYTSGSTGNVELIFFHKSWVFCRLTAD